MKSVFLRGVLVVFLAIAASRASYGQPPPTHPLDAVLDTLDSVRGFRGVAIAPGGDRVAWVERRRAKDSADSGKSAIFVSRLDGEPGAPRRIGASKQKGDAEEHDLAFSPDGSRLAFLSDADKPGQLQLYVADLTAPTKPGKAKDAGEAPPARKLTSLTGALAEPLWSPDGRSIALLVIENASKGAGPLGPAARDAGVVAEHPEEQRIAVVDAASGAVRVLSPADLYVYEYDWAPDGSAFVATSAHGSGDDNWWIAELTLVDAKSGAVRTLWKPPASTQIANPRFSPDGASIALIGGLMSDQGSTGGDVYVLPKTGGEARDVTPGMKASATTLRWLSQDRILFGEQVEGGAGLATVGRDGGPITTLWSGPEHVTASSLAGVALAKDGKTSAGVRDSFDSPPEVWAGPIGAWKQITRVNAGIAPRWGKARSLDWTTSDGLAVQGWLVPPPNVEPGRKYPMVVVVHGGPGGVHHAGWPGRFAGILASQGYFVLMPNPRGSFGAGEDFTRGNVKDFGYGDLRDILSGVDAVLAKEPVDAARIGVTGWSYGGYMTMWAVTQTNRFAAAVAGAGIVDWRSYYGQNRIDRWMIPFFGASVYDDPYIYERSSPIAYIRNVKTPTLVLHGERDSEVPAPQGYEFWHALRTLGVPTELVIFPDEGHRIARPDHQRDLARRMVGWFDRYLKAKP